MIRSSDRSCGSCTLCCIAPAIEALNKPTGARCVYLTSDGCGVYHERPSHPKFKDCVEFRCLWLDGFAGMADRPDHIGAVFMAKDDPDAPRTLRVHVIEAVRGSAQHPRVRELIGKVLGSGRTIVVANAAIVTVTKPDGNVSQYAVDPSDPLHLHVNPKVQLVQVSVRGNAATVSHRI